MTDPLDSNALDSNPLDSNPLAADQSPATTMTQLSRQAITSAADPLGWRLVMGSLRTSVAVASMAEAAEVAGQITAACGSAAGGPDSPLRLDLRSDGVLIALQTPRTGWVGEVELTLAAQVNAALSAAGRSVPDPGNSDRAVGDRAVGDRAVGDRAVGDRAVQVMELAIDALDAAAIRPFWLAVLDYVDAPGDDGPSAAIADPRGQSPTIWFQHMDAPRPQRNRIHFDIAVAPDEAQRRIQAALAAGGTLRYDAEAPAFWVLADPEGNEACICTWQGRDGGDGDV